MRWMNAALLATVIATPAEAGQDWQDDVQFHGFFTQSYIDTDDNRFFGPSESGSLDFRELGLNALWCPTPKLQLSMQVVSRDAGATDDSKPRIDYGFLDYTLSNTQQFTTGVRLGRVLNPIGLYNETRDIAFTRPSVLLPQSVYLDQYHRLALSADGLHVYHDINHKSGDYQFQVGAFEPRVEGRELETTLFLRELPGRMEAETSWVGRLLYERDLGRLRLGLSAMEINVDYQPSPAEPMPTGEFQFRPHIASVQYNRENWSFTAEYSLHRTTLKHFGAYDRTQYGESYFVQAAYHADPDWELFLRYDQLIWDRDDRDGKAFEAAHGIPAHQRFATDHTAGIRWNLLDKMTLWLEYHHIDGTGWLSNLENTNPHATERRWNLVAASVSIRF